MPDRRITPYALRVTLNGHAKRRKEPPPITPYPANFNNAGGDLLHFLSSFVEALLVNDQMVQRKNRHFGRPRKVARQGRTLLFRIYGGESGRNTRIKTTATSKEKKRDHTGVEREPFWVYAVVPADANQAWLLVETHGHHTVPGEWRTELADQFKAAYPGYVLGISQVAEMSLWTQVENSVDPRLLRFEVVRRSADGAGDHSAGHPAGMVEYNKHIWEAPEPRPGEALRALRRSFTRAKTKSGLVEITAPMEVDDLSDPDVTIDLDDGVMEIRARVLNSKGEPKTVVFDGREPRMSFVIEGVDAVPPNKKRFLREVRSAVEDLATGGGVSLPQGWDTGEWAHPDDAPELEVSPSDQPSTDQEGPAGGARATA